MARPAGADQTPEGLSAGEWRQIRDVIAADQYGAVATAEGGFAAANPANGFEARFGADGFALGSEADGWRLPVRFTGYGWAGALQPAEAAVLAADDERVELRRGAVTEWYVNRPTGIEQGFTVARAPAGEGRTLQVAMDIGGGFVARPNGPDARLIHARTGTEIAYDKLVVIDARGRTLTSRMEVAERRIVLSVDTRGAAFPIVIDPTFTQRAKLTAGDAASGAQFGLSVAVSGDTIVIGAPTAGSGSAYVFTHSAGVWSQQAKLTASDAAHLDYFGLSVGVSGDTAVVGAYGDSDAGSLSGSAYVFTRVGGVWSQQAKLTAGDAAANDRFGWAVGVSGDTALVGARGDGDAGASSGSAYVFARAGGVWSQQAKLTAGDAATGDNFGHSLAVSGDTAVVSSFLDDDAGSNSGSAYVFTRAGGAWSQQAKLTAGDAAAGDQFGQSIAVSGDTAVIGAFMDDDAGSASGSAYVFSRAGAVWSQQAKLTAGDGAAQDEFGFSVGVSGDTAVVGSHQDDDPGGSGSAYVFTRTGAVWSQENKLTAADAASQDAFGYSVAVSGDIAVIGARSDDDGGTSSGSAYVFLPVPPLPAPVPTLSEWAMILLGLILAGGAALTIQRRRLAA